MSRLPATEAPPAAPRILRVGHHFQASNAAVCGDVTIGHDSSFWFNVAVRGDVAPIRIGNRVNVQENSVLHCDTGRPLDIGDDVTIGHGAIVHGSKVGRGTLIGMGAILLGQTVIGENAIVAAGTVVSPGTIVPDGQLIMGVPGRIVRPVKPEELEHSRHNAAHYVELARDHADHPEKFYR